MVPAIDAPERSTAIDFKENDRIGERYVIKSSIGRGGMGVVYRAEDTLVNEDVALKFLRRGVLRTEKGRRLFLREAQVARRLRHENIIAVHDVGFTNEGVLYISMEYADGMSLRDFLMRYRRNRRHIPVRQAVHIMLQILDALHYAHRWVIHRDIKPENVMLLNDNQVKV
ncbi:MAG: serine/threonine protein kinase, partial [Candidatus Hydrogenedentes bacterium]|nr:serine/threonine protein kinase [Candidatus Hydrogenedentota bacterium]